MLSIITHHFPTAYADYKTVPPRDSFVLQNREGHERLRCSGAMWTPGGAVLVNGHYLAGNKGISV